MSRASAFPVRRASESRARPALEPSDALRERVKELRCLTDVARALGGQQDLDVCLQSVVEAIPPGMLHPEIAYARLRVGAAEYRTPNAEESPVRMVMPVGCGADHCGELEVGYARAFAPRQDSAGFLPEELAMTRGVARQVAGAVRRNRAETELRRREEQLALAVEGLRGGVWDLRFDPSLPDEMPDGCYFSDSLKRLLGYEPHEFPDSRLAWWSHVHPDDVPRLERAAADQIEGRTDLHDVEYRIRHRDGGIRWLRTRGRIHRDAEGRPCRWTGIDWDVTGEKESEKRLRTLAFMDPLTGLPNRAAAERRLDDAVEAARAGEQSVGVLFVDLDRFKVINDSLGHRAGDQLLVQVAGRFRSCLREEDFLARFGGDEFLVVLEALASPEAAVGMAERLQACLSEPFEIEGTRADQRASIGVAVAEDGDATTVEELLRYADVAMYRAKGSDRGSVELFHSSINAPETRRLQEENELRAALEARQLELHYQPIVDLQRRRVHGVEALVRWQHPERGLLLPGEFVPLAEETGLIVPIGEWVLEEAVRQVSRWRREGWVDESFELSVNVSARQLESAEFARRLEALLGDNGFRPRQLLLEITENVLLRASVRARDLRELGVRLAIDDFGTGYASLAYLRQMIVDTLKIDRSFTRDLATDPTCLRLVRSIFFLAESLDLNVIVEGIERPDQEDLVERLGGSLVQGFLYSRPLPAGEFVGKVVPCAAA